MTDEKTREQQPAADAGVPLVIEDVRDGLMARVEETDTERLGPDGLLSQVTKAVLERTLDEEPTDHLDYEKGDPSSRGSGNSRNGGTSKRAHTDVGSVDLDVPRDRNGEFTPKIDAFNIKIRDGIVSNRPVYLAVGH